MKKICLALVIGIIASCSINAVDAKSLTGTYYDLTYELKRIDSGHAEIQFEVRNTSAKPVDNVILDFSLRDSKSNYPRSGFVFIGQAGPDIPLKGIIPMDASFQIEDYSLNARVLQNTDFQLRKDTIYPREQFKDLVAFEEKPLTMRSGVAYWSGRITNRSAVPLKLIYFCVDYVDENDNVMKTLFLKWGGLNAGETKPYAFSNLVPGQFKRSVISVMPMEPGYDSAE